MPKNRKATEEFLDRPGVYIIKDTTKNKAYIGSTKKLNVRIKQHLIDLKRNDHANYRLQKAFNNENNLEVVVIETEGNDNYREIEQQLLNKLLPTGKLYNIAIDVIAPHKGRLHTDETKAKMSITRTGRKYSDEWCKNISDGNIGKQMSASFKEKCIENNTGKKLSDETKAKIANASRGRLHNSEAKIKMSLAKKGIPKEDEHANKCRENLSLVRKVNNITVNGINYNSILAASKDTNINYNRLYKQYKLENNE